MGKLVSVKKHFATRRRRTYSRRSHVDSQGTRTGLLIVNTASTMFLEQAEDGKLEYHRLATRSRGCIIGQLLAADEDALLGRTCHDEIVVGSIHLRPRPERISDLATRG